MTAGPIDVPPIFFLGPRLQLIHELQEVKSETGLEPMATIPG